MTNGTQVTCPMCRGDGWYMSQDPGDMPYRHDPCDACGGTGRVEPDEPEAPEEHFWRTSAGMVKTDKAMRPRDPNDHYPTPPKLARSAIDVIGTVYDHDGGRNLAIFDIGVGNGVWGQAAAARWPNARVNGCDIVDTGKPDGYKSVFIEDIRTHALKHQCRYDIVIGNPPYGIMEECVRAGLSLLKPNGAMVMLGRMEFLASQKRGFGIVGGKKKGLGLWEEFPPIRVYILSERPSFTGNNKTDASEYALYVWLNNQLGPTELRWRLWKGDA